MPTAAPTPPVTKTPGATPPAGKPSGAAPGSVQPTFNKAGQGSGQEPGVQNPKLDNNDAGSAQDKINRQRQEVDEQEANERRRFSAFNRASQRRGYFVTDHGTHVSFTPSTDEKQRQKQIVDAVYKCMEKENENGVTPSTFYFYRGNKLDPQMTKEATVLLAALQGAGGKFERHGMEIAQNPMTGPLPWESNLFGMAERRAARQVKLSVKASQEATAQVNKIA